MVWDYPKISQFLTLTQALDDESMRFQGNSLLAQLLHFSHCNAFASIHLNNKVLKLNARHHATEKPVIIICATKCLQHGEEINLVQQMALQSSLEPKREMQVNLHIHENMSVQQQVLAYAITNSSQPPKPTTTRTTTTINSDYTTNNT
ncbi:unnamed protein product [Ceratitis capitata]|uniref:(Mediterranean fruit fly) hypothetical protein n=1 Tax=Ceratitis capitata TaxID=7213 RepID=A0A811UZJ3_CERCA|nr:unnamed protein product [Ceratitis capitata]